MPNRPKSSERPQTRKKEALPPLIELESLEEIIGRIRKVVDDQRSRASLIFLGTEPIDIGIRYHFEEDNRGYTLHHDRGESGDMEKAVVESDLREIAAMALRESLRASKMTETRENIRRMLDFVIGSIFRDTRTSAGQRELTSANRKTVEKTLNDVETRQIPTLRKALTLNFIQHFIPPNAKEELQLQTGKDKGKLAPVSLLSVILEVLQRKKAADKRNRIYDHLVEPGIELRLRHNGRNRRKALLKLIQDYIQLARRTTLEKSGNIEEEFDFAQAERALDAIIGVETMERNARNTPEEITKNATQNILASVDPILWGAIAA